MYHTVGRSSEGKTSLNSRCQTRSLTCPSEQGFKLSQKNRAPKRQRGKMQRYPKVGPYFRGKWSSPTDSRFLRVSGQGPDSPTPWEWNLWTHLWRSTVPEMKTHFTNGPWGGFLFSQKRRNETGKVDSAQVIFWYIHANLYGANCCSLISCFFIRWWYPPINMKSSWVWTRHEKYTNSNQQWVIDAEVLCSTHWVTFTI